MARRLVSRIAFRPTATALAVLATVCAFGCREADEPDAEGALLTMRADPLPADDDAFLDDVAHRTFRFFWERADSVTGLVPDRWPSPSFASVAAVGFGLTAYPIGAERGWVTREAACERTLATLRFLWNAPQGTTASGVTGHRGLFYHFLDMKTGSRFETVELSTVDTALLFAGALFCQSYFDGDTPAEIETRALVDSLTARADWTWAAPRPPAIGHGWNPEEGHLPYDWIGYSEAMIVYLIALGSPTHPAPEAAWERWTSGYQWGTFHGQEYFGFGPLFGHQYSHTWVDFRGIQDAVTRAKNIDYFENSRRAALAQQAYAIANPGAWTGYDAELWGLTACDGPVDGTFELFGGPRRIHTYWARGASFTDVADDGTLCPSAAAASIAFTPRESIGAMRAMAGRYGALLYGEYGFLDAFNPSFTLVTPVQHGRVDPNHGWFDTDYLGIDQGPILAMIENHRTGLVWETMKRNPTIVRGLRRAGFTGGWLDEASP